jgi:hypothetical protein
VIPWKAGKIYAQNSPRIKDFVFNLGLAHHAFDMPKIGDWREILSAEAQSPKEKSGLRRREVDSEGEKWTPKERSGLRRREVDSEGEKWKVARDYQCLRTTHELI